MKLVSILFLTACISHAKDKPPLNAEKAVRAIIGESANQGYRGLLATAGALRNRGTLQGVYGLNAPHVDKEPARIWIMARRAWAESATNDISMGSTHWENVTAFGRPVWAAAMHKTVLVKDHQFYRK